MEISLLFLPAAIFRESGGEVDDAKRQNNPHRSPTEEVHLAPHYYQQPIYKL
jgi:hypothetical protein